MSAALVLTRSTCWSCAIFSSPVIIASSSLALVEARRGREDAGAAAARGAELTGGVAGARGAADVARRAARAARVAAAARHLPAGSGRLSVARAGGRDQSQHRRENDGRQVIRCTHHRRTLLHSGRRMSASVDGFARCSVDASRTSYVRSSAVISTIVRRNPSASKNAWASGFCHALSSTTRGALRSRNQAKVASTSVRAIPRRRAAAST